MRLRDFLEERGMKGKFFASEIGVRESLLYSWLSGAVIPSLKYVAKIEEVTKGKVRAKDLIVENTRKKRQSKDKKQHQQQKSDETNGLEKSPEKPLS